MGWRMMMMMMISKVKVAILDGRHDGRDRGASLKKDQPRLTWVPTIPLICTEYSTVLIILFFSGHDGFENFSSFSFLCFLTSQMKKVRWLQMRSTITWITFSFSRIKKIGLNFNLKQILIQNMLKIKPKADHCWQGGVWVWTFFKKGILCEQLFGYRGQLI